MAMHHLPADFPSERRQHGLFSVMGIPRPLKCIFVGFLFRALQIGKKTSSHWRTNVKENVYWKTTKPNK